MPESDTAVGREPCVACVGTSAEHAFARGDHFIAIDRRRRAAVREDRVDAAHGARVYWERGRLARSAWQDSAFAKAGETPALPGSARAADRRRNGRVHADRYV